MRLAVSTIALLTACGNNQQVGVYNSPPAVSLTSPPDGSEYNEGDTITFQALVDDDFDDPSSLTVSWSSDVDGEFESSGAVEQGVSVFQTANLTGGRNHVITIRAIDSDGEGATVPFAN